MLEILAAWPLDSLATQAAFAAAQIRRPYGEILAMRGASYILGLLSYALGQGGTGVYLVRTGARASRAAAAVALLLVVNGLALVLFSAAGQWAPQAGNSAYRMLAAGLTIAALLYLLLIAALPARHVPFRLLVPLFDAGVMGHIRATAARAPHVALLVLLHWGAFRIWGIQLPLIQAVIWIPSMILVGALPITPSGLGTVQALQVLLFSRYAPGATAAARAADVLAFSLVHQLLAIVAQAALGLACLARLQRSDR